MESLIKCPDCSGNGGDLAADISDFGECPTCEGTGYVEEGTKSSLKKLLLHKG